MVEFSAGLHKCGALPIELTARFCKQRDYEGKITREQDL